MKLNLRTSAFIVITILTLALVPTAAARRAAHQTGFIRWRAAENGFAGWTLNGVRISTGDALEFDGATAVAGTDPYTSGAYNGRNYYNGGTFFVGEATSPEISTAFDYKEAIASWNANTPSGSWVEVQFRTQYDGTRWSKWYILGIWAADTTTVERHSVQSQGDADGFVAVDTFVSTNKKEVTNKFQLKLRLFSANGIVTPSIQNASVAYSTEAPKSASASAGNLANWDTFINLPKCSQMVYPDGGEVWCSPTSTSMVLGGWGYMPGICEPRVRNAVEGVFDWVYDGHGNWPFNTAYASAVTQGTARPLEGYVARFTSLEKVEEFVKAGVPVIMSIAWGNGDLTGADIASTNGHLLVLVGFDDQGNPIANDPASPADGTPVQHTYLRGEFEPLWLEASGGTVYLIYPAGMTVPSIP